MESTMWWTIGALAAVGVVAIVFGMAVLISLWWLIVPLVGAFWGGWFGFSCGIVFVVVLGTFLKILKKKK